MDLTVSFKNLEPTEAINDRIDKKAQKLKKFLQGKTKVYWTCWVADNDHHSEVRITGNKVNIHACASADNLYKTFDLVIGKLEKQLGKKTFPSKIHRKGADSEDFQEENSIEDGSSLDDDLDV